MTMTEKTANEYVRRKRWENAMSFNYPPVKPLDVDKTFIGKMEEMEDIYTLISEVYERCQAQMDALKDKECLEYATLLKLRCLQSQAADVILDYRRGKQLSDKPTEGN